MNSGTLDGRLVDCRRITALDTGQKDFLLAGSTTANNVNLYIDNCPTMDTTDVAISSITGDHVRSDEIDDRCSVPHSSQKGLPAFLLRVSLAIKSAEPWLT